MRADEWSGPWPFVAVGEQHDDARPLAPLLLGARDELVDDDLGSVGEVAELGFPQHEGVGAFDRVPVLEGERGVLAQQRVVDREPRLVVGQVAERQPFLAVHPVVEDRVARHEGAAAAS
jgi:hypothetical protein